jgi:hypothetical protein
MLPAFETSYGRLLPSQQIGKFALAELMVSAIAQQPDGDVASQSGSVPLCSNLWVMELLSKHVLESTIASHYESSRR